MGMCGVRCVVCGMCVNINNENHDVENFIMRETRFFFPKLNDPRRMLWCNRQFQCTRHQRLRMILRYQPTSAKLSLIC
jgi:hypothetical protein